MKAREVRLVAMSEADAKALAGISRLKAIEELRAGDRFDTSAWLLGLSEAFDSGITAEEANLAMHVSGSYVVERRKLLHRMQREIHIDFFV